MTDPSSETSHRALARLFGELTEGAAPDAGWILNRSDAGLLASLDRLSAADASALHENGSSVAAHVDHLRYGLSLLLRWSAGEDPFRDADYSRSWQKTTVSDEEWRALRKSLADTVRKWRDALARPREPSEESFMTLAASVAHLAYHLGALRQMEPRLSGPRERGPRGPRVRTPRLLLDPIDSSDLASLHEHWCSPGVRRYLWDGKLIPRERVEESIAESQGLFEREGAGLWAVRERGDTRLIGCAGFWYFHEPPELELLYSLSESHWGRGLGRECAAALIDHAFDELGWPVVQSSADAPNEASLRLLRALGMQPAGTRAGEFGTIEVFRVTQEDWRGRKRS